VYDIPKQLFVNQELFDLVKEAKRLSGISESQIYREGGRRYATEIIRGAGEREAVPGGGIPPRAGVPELRCGL